MLTSVPTNDASVNIQILAIPMDRMTATNNMGKERRHVVSISCEINTAFLFYFVFILTWILLSVGLLIVLLKVLNGFIV